MPLVQCLTDQLWIAFKYLKCMQSLADVIFFVVAYLLVSLRSGRPIVVGLICAGASALDASYGAQAPQ